MPRRGGRRKKTRTHRDPNQLEAEQKIPKCFVFRRGRVAGPVHELVDDLRRVMMPNTALRLQERRTNRMKDYLHVAGQFGISHFLVLSQTEANVNLRLACVPRGPTLTFQVLQYSLTRLVREAQRRPVDYKPLLHNAPLVVLNNFDGSKPHLKLAMITFQNMFPAINVTTVKLSECKRVVLVHYNKTEDTIEFRHYAIRASPTGVTRSVKRIVQTRIPNLGTVEDISEYVLFGGGAASSESEFEDETSTVTLPGNYAGRGNRASQQSSIRLTELGPRMCMRLTKVVRGLNEGEVLYHSFVHKSAEEIAAARKRSEEKRQLKEQRRSTQEANVARKRAEREARVRERQLRREQKMAAMAAGGGTSDALAGMPEEAALSGDEEEEEEAGEEEEGGEQVPYMSDEEVYDRAYASAFGAPAPGAPEAEQAVGEAEEAAAPARATRGSNASKTAKKHRAAAAPAAPAEPAAPAAKADKAPAPGKSKQSMAAPAASTPAPAASTPAPAASTPAPAASTPAKRARARIGRAPDMPAGKPAKAQQGGGAEAPGAGRKRARSADEPAAAAAGGNGQRAAGAGGKQKRARH